MKFDQSVPSRLKKTQLWFGSIIGRPMHPNNTVDPVAPSGNLLAEEAKTFIAPSPTLSPDRRIQLYNQQYWWRLLSTLQDSFPTVLRLFGYDAFNGNIAIPYLVKYPSQHWSLTFLGDYLPQWIEEEYHADDKPLVYNAAKVDWAYNDSFVAADSTEIQGNESALLNQKMTLQHHVNLFSLPYDLFEFRMEIMKQVPDYWIDNDFPTLKYEESNSMGHYVLFRNRSHNISVIKISQPQFQLLERFKDGETFDHLCEWLEQLPEDSTLVTEASEQLHQWIHDWISLQWLKVDM